MPNVRGRAQQGEHRGKETARDADIAMAYLSHLEVENNLFFCMKWVLCTF